MKFGFCALPIRPNSKTKDRIYFFIPAFLEHKFNVCISIPFVLTVLIKIFNFIKTRKPLLEAFFIVVLLCYFTVITGLSLYPSCSSVTEAPASKSRTTVSSVALSFLLTLIFKPDSDPLGIVNG